MKTLITGGARSGKSSYAENLVSGIEVVDYLATSINDPNDSEWVERIRKHRMRRPATWRTIETIDLAEHIRRPTNVPLLIDCLALWCSRVMDKTNYWNNPNQATAKFSAEVDLLVAALSDTNREIVMVTNEVGLGIVPASFAGRAYRDELGRLNARVAQVSDRLVLCVAGCPLQIKPAFQGQPL